MAPPPGSKGPISQNGGARAGSPVGRAGSPLSLLIVVDSVFVDKMRLRICISVWNQKVFDEVEYLLFGPGVGKIASQREHDN